MKINKKSKKVKCRKIFLIFLISVVFGSALFLYFENNFVAESEIKTNNPARIKIGYASDLHAVSLKTKGKPVRLIRKHEGFVDGFVGDLKSFNPEIAVFNGDLIDGTNWPAETGMFELAKIKERFDILEMPIFWTIGNHDLRSVNRDQWKEALGIDYLDKTFENGNYKLIFLDDNYSVNQSENAEFENLGNLLSERQLDWLKKELKTDKIKIVFMHQPPFVDLEMKSNYLPKGTEEIQEIFSQNDVAAVFSGHIENLFSKTIGKVRYFVLPGITKNKDYPNAVFQIIFHDKNPLVRMKYIENGQEMIKILK